MLTLSGRILLGALLLLVLPMAGGLVYTALPIEPIPRPSANPLPWNIAVSLAYSIVLTWIASRSRLRGWRLAIVIGALLFGITNFTSLIEARFFDIFGTAQMLGLLLTTIVTTMLVAPLFVLVMPPPAEKTAGSWIPSVTPARLIVASFAYLVTYFGAGMVVFPFVRDFYANKTMPNPLALVAMQLCLRGPIFVMLIFVLLRAVRSARSEAILMSGTVMSVLGGLALIVPNPFMPDWVRWPHLVEVATSNFLFGCFVAWLLTRDPARTAAPHAQPQQAT